MSLLEEASACFEKGNAYWQQGNHSLAISEFDSFIRQYPDHPPAYFGRGCIYLDWGNSVEYGSSHWEKACSDFTVCLEKDEGWDGYEPFAIKDIKTQAKDNLVRIDIIQRAFYDPNLLLELIGLNLSSTEIQQYIASLKLSRKSSKQEDNTDTYVNGFGVYNGVKLFFKEKILHSITLYSDFPHYKEQGIFEYKYPLPCNLDFKDNLVTIESKLGKPELSFNAYSGKWSSKYEKHVNKYSWKIDELKGIIISYYHKRTIFSSEEKILDITLHRCT